MYDERQQRLIDIRNNLVKKISVANERAMKGKANEEKVSQFKTRLEQVVQERAEVKECGNHLHDIYKNVQSYAKNHQDSAKEMLNLAIIAAGEMVPDAGTRGIHLHADESGRVSVVNETGQNINLREGGGYRAVLGALLRYASLKAQPDALQLMLYDESFFTLSDTTTQSMKDIFSAMKKDCNIICIEQRHNVMDGILDSEYNFRKDDMGNTTVSKVF